MLDSPAMWTILLETNIIIQALAGFMNVRWLVLYMSGDKNIEYHNTSFLNMCVNKNITLSRYFYKWLKYSFCMEGNRIHIRPWYLPVIEIL